ncbi:hypothetical protein [Methylobacterium soli]|uniref:hypothetical protein n=1 Tax=Methylobacterium soli TaxID=553447 RepID=UPI001781DD67|nr:hypothetical protein [Methylobacterium soli]
MHVGTGWVTRHRIIGRWSRRQVTGHRLYRRRFTRRWQVWSAGGGHTGICHQALLKNLDRSLEQTTDLDSGSCARAPVQLFPGMTAKLAIARHPLAPLGFHSLVQPVALTPIHFLVTSLDVAQRAV